jgi:hypothetical protein
MNNLTIQNLFETVDKSAKRIAAYERIKPLEAVKTTSYANLANKRIDVIVAGFKLSIPRFKAGVRLWMKFCNKFSVPVFPVRRHVMETFIANFRVSVTARNYVSSVKNACLVLEFPTSWDSITLRRLINNTEKLAPATQVEVKPGIQLNLLKRLVPRSDSLSSCLKLWTEVRTILVLSYSMLLRVPSECIPLQFTKALSSDPSSHSAVKISHSTLSVFLRRRKNCNRPSEIRRECICTGTEVNIICPVHAVLTYLARIENRLQHNNRLFTITADAFHYRIRLLLQMEGFSEGVASTFSSKALRRGGARDIVKYGFSTEALKAAGMWSSNEYQAYLDKPHMASSTMKAIMIKNQ